MSKALLNNPDAQLIGAFLQAGDNFVSGNDLARKLAISRPAVWARLQRLETAGFAFEAVRNRGHRLREIPSCVHPALLDWWAHVNQLSLPFLYFPSIDSTNTEAERQFQQGRNAPFIVVSSEQTAGRGRRGRTWISDAADNLYLTLALEPQLPAQILSGFTLWAGIHLAQGLNKFLDRKQGAGQNNAIMLKWPNDLEYDGRKVGGLLAEAKSDSDGIRQLIVGFGLNVSAAPQIDRGGALAQIADIPAICLNQLAVNCACWLLSAYDAVLQGVDKRGWDLPMAYACLDNLKGKSVQAYRNNETISGIANGITPTGGLILQQQDYSSIVVEAGEVTLQAQ
jgi:BirA family biotin operon repressor/biotin-[acetyl-CoA-carboxylase] ligase